MDEDSVKKYLDDSIQKIKSKALDILEIEAPKIIRKNFALGGRPVPWKPSNKLKKHPGSKTLIVTGNLSNVLATKNEAESSVTITTNPLSRAYARIQQEGGTINMPARTMKFRTKRYKNGTSKTVFASSRHKKFTEKISKPYRINIQARPYMVIPPDEINRIIKLISSIKL